MLCSLSYTASSELKFKQKLKYFAHYRSLSGQSTDKELSRDDILLYFYIYL